MDLIAKDVVTAEWVIKKQVYRFVGMKSRDGEMVDIEVRDWEYTKEEIENSIAQLNLTLQEQKAKLELFSQ